MQQTPESGEISATGSYRWAAFSETGDRSRNEDRWGQRRSAGGLAIWVVADGMGGHDDGNLAARLAVDAFLDAAAAQDNPEQAVRSGLAAARQAVSAMGNHGQAIGAPSSTLVGLAVKGAIGFVGHAGDSPLYQFRKGTLVHRTSDHNIRELKRAVMGTPTLSQAVDPDASQLTRSLGDPLDADAEDVFSPLELKARDLLLLCSDGISQHISEDDPGAWAADVENEAQLIDKARQAVVSANLQRQDNYTAVAIAIERTGSPAVFPLRTWLVAAVVAILFTALAMAGIYSWQVSQEGPSEALLANKAPPLKKGAPANAVVTSPPGTNSDPLIVSPSETLTATGPPAVVAPPPARTVQAVVARPGELCRQVEVPEQQCTSERVENACDPRQAHAIRKSGHLFGTGSSREEAETSCKRQVEVTVGQECKGAADIRELSCQCETDEGSPSGVYCKFSARADCKGTQQACADINISAQRCKTVRVQRLICEKR